MLVGDSLGMVLQGHDSTVPVTIEHMAYHTELRVARGNRGSLVIADMPFMAYRHPQQALANATPDAGRCPDGEDGGGYLAEREHPACWWSAACPVCAHLGLTPQSVNVFGGFKVQGRTPKGAKSILADAVEIQDAGAAPAGAGVCPTPLASGYQQQAGHPVIGIGAGPGTDAQVLVMHDMLGSVRTHGPLRREFHGRCRQHPGGPARLRGGGQERRLPARNTPEHGYD